MKNLFTAFGICFMGLGLVWKVNNLYPTAPVEMFETYEQIDTLQLGTFSFGNELKDSILLTIDSSNHYQRDDSMVIDSLYSSAWISDSTDWLVNTVNGKITSVCRITEGKTYPDTFDWYNIK